MASFSDSEIDEIDPRLLLSLIKQLQAQVTRLEAMVKRPETAHQECQTEARPPAAEKPARAAASAEKSARRAADAENSYATVLKKPQVAAKKSKTPTHHIKKMLQSSEQFKPVEFVKVHMKVRKTHIWKGADRRKKVVLARQMLQVLGIQRKVRDFSFIGQGILELYVAEPVVEEVRLAITNNGAEIIDHFNVMSTQDHGRKLDDVQPLVVRRLGFLYHRNTLVKMRECILHGFSMEIKEQAVKYAEDLAKPRQNAAGAAEEDDGSQMDVENGGSDPNHV
jgi:hypothetical protein